MEIEKLLQADTYYCETDLRYNKALGFCLSAAQYREYLDRVDDLAAGGESVFIPLDLRPFNSRQLFFARHRELTVLYEDYISLTNAEDLFSPNREEMRRARIYSEVEGSLNIEGYNSTRALFDRLLEGKEPDGLNEIIIRNMGRALTFIESAPAFDAENLFKLYTLVSEDTLKPEQCLRPGDRYRYDMVFVSSYNGAPAGDIPACMDSLFRFVAAHIKDPDPLIRFLLPHIVHYYMVYVHPYFDCNGRMARLCSLWVAELTAAGNAPYFISEAINDTKSDYYRALSKTRDARNDLTHFLIYILRTSLRYGLCYRELNLLADHHAAQGESLNVTELISVKRILLCAPERWFTWKDYTAFLKQELTKQGALKALNKLEIAGILISKINTKKEKVFRFLTING